MDQFVWRDSYSVHNEELDTHHQKLIALFNTLYESFLADADNDAIARTVQELIAYADYHFRAEERFMAAIDYAGLDRHKTEHLFFIKKITALQYRNFLREATVLRELVIYLGNWLIHHVIQEDRKYAVDRRAAQRGDS